MKFTEVLNPPLYGLGVFISTIILILANIFVFPLPHRNTRKYKNLSCTVDKSSTGKDGQTQTKDKQNTTRSPRNFLVLDPEQDYVKWRGLLLYRFLATLVDSDASVRSLGAFTLTRPLITKV